MDTSICGIQLKCPIFNASGCWCTTSDALDSLRDSTSGAILSKSGTITPRSGYTEPRLYIDDNVSINAMGIPNQGYKFYTEYGNTIHNKPFIQSIYPFSTTELKTMLTDINSTITTKKLIEINISCPTVYHNIDIINTYLDTINQLHLDTLILGLKLPPLFESYQFDVVSTLLNQSQVRFITCTNSIPNGLLIDPVLETTRIHPNNGQGGISGKLIKPIALSNVFNFYQRLNPLIDIIGCGGIVSGSDVFEYILCGATAVQIGTQLLTEGPKCFTRISNELSAIMKQKNYRTINDFKGLLKIKTSKL